MESAWSPKTYPMSLLLNLEEIALNLDNFQDILCLKSINTEFREKLSSPEFARFYHYRKYGYFPPEIVHTIWRINAKGDEPKTTIPWRIEFSFLPQEYFQKFKEKVYFRYGNVLSRTLKDETKWIPDLIYEIIPKLHSTDCYLMRPSGKQLTREEIEYIVERAKRYTRSVPVEDYIDTLADYGDIDYFVEAMKEIGITPSRKDFARFTRRMVEYGREGLLEAYRRYKTGDYKELTIMKYHPGQRRIVRISRVQLNFLENIEKGDYRGAYRVLKKGTNTQKSLETSLRFPEFIRWMIREHPEDTKQWYHQTVSNIDILLLRGKKIEHPHELLHKSVIESGLPWEKIAPIFGDDYWAMRRFIWFFITADRYDIIHKYYAGNGSDNFKKAIEYEMSNHGCYDLSSRIMYEEITGKKHVNTLYK